MFPYEENTLEPGQEIPALLPQLETLIGKTMHIQAIKLLRFYMGGFWRKSDLTELERASGVSPRLIHEGYDPGLKEAKDLFDLIRDGYTYRQIDPKTREAIKRYRQLRQARQQTQDLYDSIVIEKCIHGGLDDLLIQVKGELNRQMLDLLDEIEL